ncbi:UDP-N-acetylglucosamine--N-acetylmuramyl-(pentapeptide) pyrophosphoryl-undecaprenol N-acetylglucosamine transferase [Psychromonas marina]|uniref:UDP-N-acetylglucosamine--N-acetylmuramyl-(pentapeptide) pyrophosphoryl-undecaprenol N-acetylglucosamine transferase n=1 Tax=Psychromonas marina TaxID=88364 RepID=A0ABQ6DY90_9GAMM|nr:undecaprenyldiphospho-muramoylpentapeptide beta-N-acetylglucosaminyltransferase [Psychromonas marina]GLS89833.1 UDP-N-acetylglucosamine--N-acetylmuramyl-(pentapeptide) pyrophosphoryl-undecaprenol N-acetylglucosamine transferase [Psychromonas marina]
MKTNKTLLVMAGGTGGHVFPGLAVADKLKKQGWKVSWLGTADRMEAQLVPEHGYEIDFIDIAGVRGNGLKRLLMAPIRIIKSILQARAVLKNRNIDLVLGMGGFASGPGGIAAWTMGIPVLLHEQNAAAGLTNRILARFAKKVLMGFDGAFTDKKAILVGNPVRESVLKLPEKVISEPQQSLKVLVVGGSLGAKVLNDLLPDVIATFENDSVSVIHQTGKGKLAQVQDSYATSCKQINVDVQEFITDMDASYAWADLVICRAGALTVAEVAVVGLPAIFVPLPHAVDDHQTKNAQDLVSQGGAVLIPQKQLNAKKLSDYLQAFSQNRQLLIDMSEQCKKAGIADATERVAQICIETVNSHK